MTDDKVAHLTRLLQELTYNFYEANAYLARAWGAHAKMHDALDHFRMAQKKMVEELQHRED